MWKRQPKKAVLLWVFAFLVLPSVGFGQETIEGKVVRTTLTGCGYKPGTCVGSLELETAVGGKPTWVPVTVPGGTYIRRGEEDLFLPALRGSAVTILYEVKPSGEKVAKSIAVKTGAR